VRGLHGRRQLRPEAVPPHPDGDLGRHLLPQSLGPHRDRPPLLAENPNHTGSLGIAITEALEDCVQREDTKYSLGSVLNHVMHHQTIIGEEALKQMEMAGEYPDIVIGCFGGGSNFAGISFPFDQGALPVRSWRYGKDDTADENVHAGTRFYTGGNTCRRTAIPRRFAPCMFARPR
jgi:hypothetical protein